MVTSGVDESGAAAAAAAGGAAVTCNFRVQSSRRNLEENQIRRHLQYSAHYIEQHLHAYDSNGSFITGARHQRAIYVSLSNFSEYIY